MNKPKLVIMAAGMGSRYGGLKQIDPVDEYGNIIIDFSIYDALRAGFEDIVFIIKHEIEEDFKAAIGRRMEHHANVTYVYQQLDMLPDGFSVPDGRIKPWGTSHAVLCAKDALAGSPFVPLNADDYYGPEAFKIAYDFLMNNHNKNEHCVIGYKVANTLTEHGYVSRGVCEVSDSGLLTDIHERTKIRMAGGGAEYTEDDGQTFTKIPDDATCSMNMWGFNSGMMDELSAGFPMMLKKILAENPLKGEDYLPEAVRRAIAADRLSVKVIPTHDRWHGVTYPEDKPALVAAIRDIKAKGIYPEKLWNDR